MKQEFIDLYALVSATHRETMTRLVELERQLKSGLSMGEMADLAYALRDSAKLSKDTTVELNKLSSLLAKIYTTLWASDPNSTEHIDTEWCSCTPDPKHHSAVPKMEDNPSRYMEIMKAMGLPEDLALRGLFRLSRDSLAELITELKREGKPVPECFENSYIEHRLSVRAKRKLASAIDADPS